MTYDKDAMKEAARFEDYVYSQFMHHLGICVQPFRSRFGQIEWGENSGRIEVKFDKTFRETDNLYIEIAEKSNASNKEFVPSGIHSKTLPFLYVIGDERRFFVFTRRQLEMEHMATKWKYKETQTSKGFLLPAGWAQANAAAVVDCDPDCLPDFIRRSTVQH